MFSQSLKFNKNLNHLIKKNFHSSRVNLNSNLKNKVTNGKYEVAIIGGGHNGLTCASYLAKAGLKVIVLERRHLVGGAAVTEEIFPDFKFSRCSYLNSLFRPQIVDDLELQKFGYQVIPRNPSSCTPLLDGRSLLLGSDSNFNFQQISKFSTKDAINFIKYENLLDQLATHLEPLLDQPPTAILSDKLSIWQKYKEIRKLFPILSNLYRESPENIAALYELFTAPASRILDKWFESEPLKSTLATDAVIGAMVAPSTPSSGYVLFHHVMGQTNGVRGVWSYMKGGMGSISQALSQVAQNYGATIVCDAEVTKIDVKNGQVKSIVLKDGTEIEANIFVSNTTPKITFEKLLDSNVATNYLPKSFIETIKNFDYTSPVMKINLALDKLPIFKAFPQADETIPGPQHFGTIHFTNSMQEIELAYADAAFYGRPSTRPVIEMTIPSSLDPTIAPPGKHVAQLFVQYTPYNWNWEDPGVKEQFAERVFNVIEEFCPGFKSSIIGKDILSPKDLENIFGLTGGNIFHGAMGLDQLFLARPAAGFSGYQSPIKNLFMCGSSTHPGGGVMGAPGKNASEIILKNKKQFF
eukprot:TRINITY_DN3651_c0_g1_i1.p1 TRINITY_DN3651_c0_g1~~TRINITY_DN3651_c0_g1_i1.p1  ORF type:complete len:581 (+),score=293.20 TRINITY_DN3651_c0_g1_i1:140-1882(+)